MLHVHPHCGHSVDVKKVHQISDIGLWLQVGSIALE